MNREVALNKGTYPRPFGLQSRGSAQREIVRRFTTWCPWATSTHPKHPADPDVTCGPSTPTRYRAGRPMDSSERLNHECGREKITGRARVQVLGQTMHALRAGARTARLTPRASSREQLRSTANGNIKVSDCVTRSSSATRGDSARSNVRHGQRVASMAPELYFRPMTAARMAISSRARHHLL